MTSATNSRVSGTVSIEEDRELKAFIYQHLAELQPYLSPESQIAVLVQVEQDQDGEVLDNVLTLVATLGEYRLEIEGRDENIYEAFMAAQREMLEQLEEWYETSLDLSDRDAEIQSVIEKRHLIH